MREMDQRELFRQLEEHFRNEDRAQLDQRKQIHLERESISDDEWWEELIERTRKIRPQMLEIFERNKIEMIAKRFLTISSEEEFREKVIQKRVMELLPHLSALRLENDEQGKVTDDQIRLAILRQTTVSEANAKNHFPVSESMTKNQLDSDSQSNFIENLIELQLRRKEELN